MISKRVVLFFLIRCLETSSFCVDVWKQTTFKLPFYLNAHLEIPILKVPCFFVWWWTTKTFTLCKFLEGVFNTVVSVWCCYCSKSLFIACIDLRGAFLTYVYKILPFFDHLPTLGLRLWMNFFTVIRENLHTADIFSTTYPPRLVNVVCERPLTAGNIRISFHMVTSAWINYNQSG